MYCKPKGGKQLCVTMVLAVLVETVAAAGGSSFLSLFFAAAAAEMITAAETIAAKHLKGLRGTLAALPLIVAAAVPLPAAVQLPIDPGRKLI